MSFPQTKEKTGLEEVIDALQDKLLCTDPTSDEFAKIVGQLDKLYKMKSYAKDNRVSMDALISVFGNLAGIVLILGFERVHIVTSKAIGFVLKSRV